MTPQDIDQLLRPVPLKDLRVILRARGINPAGGKESCEDRLKEHMLATGDYSLRAPDDFTAYSAIGADSEKNIGSERTNNYMRPGGQQNLGNHLTGRSSSRVLAPPGGVSQITFGSEPPQSHAPQPDYHHYQQPADFQPPAQDYRGYQPPPADYPPQQGFPPDYQQFAAPQYGGPAPQHGSSAQPPGGQAYAAPSSFYSGYDAPPAQPAKGSPAPGQHGMADNNYSRPNGMQNVGNFITDRPTSRVLAPPGGKSQISFG